MLTIYFFLRNATVCLFRTGKDRGEASMVKNLKRVFCLFFYYFSLEHYFLFVVIIKKKKKFF